MFCTALQMQQMTSPNARMFYQYNKKIPHYSPDICMTVLLLVVLEYACIITHLEDEEDQHCNGKTRNT